MAVLLSTEWVGEVRSDRVVICSDLHAALVSLNSFVSQSRHDVLYEVLQCLYRVKQRGICDVPLGTSSCGSRGE